MTDEELMGQLAQGDTDALAPIIERYQTDLFRFCVHYLRDVERAQDLTQETFIRVYSACSRFDPSRKFRPWVLCIARNLCLNELKRRKAVPMESLEGYLETASFENDGGELSSSVDQPDGFLAAKERVEVLNKALDSLADEAREIVVLRYFERMSAREIAKIVGSTEGAIRTRLHRIIVSLREKFIECRDDL